MDILKDGQMSGWTDRRSDIQNRKRDERTDGVVDIVGSIEKRRWIGSIVLVMAEERNLCCRRLAEH